MGIYLDYNATTPIEPRVLEKMIDVYKNSPGNADSRTHNYGENARKVVEEARKKVACLLGIESNEVFFTSGATESDNIAIQGLIEHAERTGKKHIITTAIEHKAVLETCKELAKRGFSVDFVKPDKTGRVSSEEILGKIRKDTLLVSVMHVSNETGIIQPVKEIGESISDKEVFFHIDATQSCGKLVKEVKDLNYDMLSFSAHKLRGPQGVGVLALRRKQYMLPPVKGIMFGGQQEHSIRPGTLPVALIAGLGEACVIAEKEEETNTKNCSIIRELILKMLNESALEYRINGDGDYSVSSTINIYIPNVSSEALMLSTKQYCGVSNGSACTSNSYKPSYVLEAMGIPDNQIEESIRISWGPETNMDDVRESFGKMIEIAKSLQST